MLAAPRCFKVKPLHYTIIDAPSHRAFIMSIVTGSPQAEVALIRIPCGWQLYEGQCEGQPPCWRAIESDSPALPVEHLPQVLNAAHFHSSSSQVSVKFQSSFGQVAVKLRSSCGHVAVKLRSRCGQVAVKLRSSCGQVAVKLRSSCGHVAVKLRSSCGRVAVTLRSRCG